MNSNQKKLKQMIREEESSITDQEFFTSSAFHQYLTSQARAATGRYCYGLQALISWVQSYMVCGDIREAAHYTILPSATADAISRAEVEESCLDTVLPS